MLQYLVILGACCQFTGIAIYIKEMINGKVKPNRVTWILRSLAPIIGAIAAFSEGVRRAILPTFISGFGPLLVVCISFYSDKAYRKLEKFDYLCGLLSLLALVGWYITNEAIIAIVLSIISDFLAGFPTIKKARYDADSEGPTPYMGGLIGAITSIFAFSTWNYNEISFPIYLLLFNLSMIIFIFTRRKKQK